MRLFAGFFPYALGYLKSAWHTIKGKLIVRNWNANVPLQIFSVRSTSCIKARLCVCFLVLSRRPKQKAFWLEALWIQRWQEKHPLLGEVCHGGMASFPWFHWFLLDGDLHQDIRMIEDLKEECVPDHGSV